MGIQSRQNKKFGYKPRYYENKSEGSPFGMEHKFDKYRTTVGKTPGLKGKFTSAFEELKSSRKRGANRTIIFIILLCVLLFLYIIDFDLSIFSIN